jgi:hypothetical protein
MIRPHQTQVLADTQDCCGSFTAARASAPEGHQGLPHAGPGIAGSMTLGPAEALQRVHDPGLRDLRRGKIMHRNPAHNQTSVEGSKKSKAVA